MSDRKRKRQGKRRKSIRCRICTKYRWMGNAKERHSFRDRRAKEAKRTEED